MIVTNKLKPILLVSQNLTKHLSFPQDTVLRINLAWVNTRRDLIEILSKHKSHQIFLDLPTKRVKPPNNKYTLDELKPIFKKHKNIKYFAISNVESAHDINNLKKFIPSHISIVPKIESIKAIMNIKEITTSLDKDDPIIMLDHDDLFSSIIKANEPITNFKKYIQNLITFCKKHKIRLLRARGIIFSEE